MKPDFETVWQRLRGHQGEEFKTKTGLPFSYKISGDIFWPSRTNYNIAKSDFAKAFELLPIAGPGEINELVRGPAYVWAVLHDRRIM